MIRILAGGVALWAMSVAGAAAQVGYHIDLTEKAEYQRGDVEIVIPRVQGTLDVQMPAWRTGRYEILDQAQGVRDFSAFDAGGNPLEWRKIDKSTWRIVAPDAGPVRVTYEIFADQRGDRLRHIDDSHAYLNASGVFMYAPSKRQEPVTVRLDVPQGWTSWSGLERVGDHVFQAPDYDVFADSPIETGRSDTVTFDADGVDYRIVRWGNGNLDMDQAAIDLAKIGEASQKIWEGYPFEDYLYMVHATDGEGGATEYANSTIIQRPRYSFTDGGYRSFLTTAAHELIHAWNVKAYRAAGLTPYDYQSENYTDLLWLHEGSTSYFSWQMMAWAGLYSIDDYLGTLSGTLAGNALNPGRLVQSAADASFDQWIAPDNSDRSLNDTVSIYREGAIVSLLLDLALIERTDGRVTYRDVHQALWERYQTGNQAFTAIDVQQILGNLTGQSWTDWWAANVDAPLDPDLAAPLASVGLRLAESEEDATATAGWRAEAGEDGALRLTAVPRGMAAWDAGLRPDDIIVAIDGLRVTPDRIEEAIAGRAVGETVTVTYFRRDRMAQKNLTLQAMPTLPRVVPVERPTARQARLFEAWMEMPHPNR